MDCFSTLPSSVLVTIAKSVPNLASLHSLRLASPTCAALFVDQRQAAEIVETVATGSLDNINLAMFGYIWELLQLPESAWSTILERPRSVTPWIGPRPAPCISLRSANWPPTTESTLRMLVLANAVHCAAHRCLHTLLQRFIALRPRRPIDTKFNLDSKREPWKYSPNSPFQPPPLPKCELAGIKLKVATAPLEWFEEQRALYGAWQIALYTVVRDGPQMDIWPPHKSKIGHLKALKIGGQWELEELPQTLLDKSTDAASRSSCRRLSDIFPWAPSCGQTGCLVQPMGRATGFNLKAMSRGQHFFYRARRSPWSTLRAAPSGPFRILGFKIWGEKRFIAMGLLTSDYEIEQQFAAEEFAEYSDMVAWRSVLTMSQVEALEAAQYAVWRRWQQETATSSD